MVCQGCLGTISARASRKSLVHNLGVFASWRTIFFTSGDLAWGNRKLSAQEILQRLMKLIRRFQMRDMSDIGQLHQARAGNLGGGFPG
jgi:hypothetical protein